MRFKASWIGPKDQPEWCEFYISGEHNSHRCVTFLVSTSIYKCFSSADAPDRSHGLAPHVRTKILELAHGVWHPQEGGDFGALEVCPGAVVHECAICL